MSGTSRRLAEAANQVLKSVTEAYKAGDTVKVPHKGKMVKGKIVRYDDGGTDKARQSGGGYVVDVGEPASITVPANKVVKLPKLLPRMATFGEELVGGQKRLDVKQETAEVEESVKQIDEIREAKLQEAIGDDEDEFDPKDVEAVVKVCKALQSKGVGGKSAFKNFAHFKLLWQAWYELGKMKTADKKGNLGYLAGIDPFKDQGFKAAKRAGCAGAWNALIGGPGFYAAFLDWADGEVEGRYIKPVNTIGKSVLDMFWGLYRD